VTHDSVQPAGRSNQRRLLLGLVFFVLSFACLWLGSPAHTGGDANLALVWGFNLLFALGFIITAMALMGAERDYPALVSGLVLYFIVGALVCVFLYVTETQVGGISLVDANTPGFWSHWLLVAATWPFELIARAGLLDYMSL
jgi:hypothetical protein